MLIRSVRLLLVTSGLVSPILTMLLLLGLLLLLHRAQISRLSPAAPPSYHDVSRVIELLWDVDIRNAVSRSLFRL